MSSFGFGCSDRSPHSLTRVLADLDATNRSEKQPHHPPPLTLIQYMFRGTRGTAAHLRDSRLGRSGRLESHHRTSRHLVGTYGTSYNTMGTNERTNGGG